MEKQERVKVILGISLLYIIITSVFSFIVRLCSSIISQNDINVKARYFLQSNLLWMIIVAVIIIALALYLKKLNEGSHYSLLGNSLIRVTAGLLVVLGGIISLSSTVPLYVASIQSAIQSSLMMQQSMPRMVTEVIISNAVSVLVFLCQILVGIFFIRFYKDKTT